LDFDIHEHRKRFQQTLLDFINSHLDVGFTFCRGAELEMQSPFARKDEGEYLLFRENARIALESVRKFEGRIEDPEVWAKIHARADQLEKLIEGL
jgi:hypothetical protein